MLYIELAKLEDKYFELVNVNPLRTKLPFTKGSSMYHKQQQHLSQKAACITKGSSFHFCAGWTH